MKRVIGKLSTALAVIGMFAMAHTAKAQLLSPLGGDENIRLGAGNAAGVVLDDGTWGIGHIADESGIASLEITTEHDATTSGNAGRALSTGGFLSLIFDLDGTFTLEGLALWNGGEDDRPGNGRTIAQRDQTDRGIQSAEFFYATDGVGDNNTSTWTSLGSFDFTRELFDTNNIPELSPGVPDLNSTVNAVGPIAAQVKGFAAVAGITHVRMDATNWGDGNIVNLSEIAFVINQANAPKFIADPVVKANATNFTDYGPANQSLDGSATNAAGSVMAYAKLGGPDWLVVASNGDLSGTPDVVGTNEFSVSATGGGGTGLGTLRIIVDPFGSAPEFTADPVVKADGAFNADYGLESQTLAGSATDADLDTLSYFKDGGPAWLNIASNGALSGVCNVAGTNSFPISVDDGNGNSDSATLQIIVTTSGSAPEFTVDPITKADGELGAEYALQAQSLTNSATDADGDTLSYFKDGGPGWLNIASNGALSGSCNVIGTNSFTVLVDDGNGNTDTATLLIFVEDTTPVAPDPAKLLAHWPMDEGVGGTTANIVGSSYVGVIDGAVWTNGTGNRATYLQFDGRPAHVDPGLTLPLMTDENDFTWAVWVKKDAAVNQNAVVIGNRKNGSNTDYTPRQFIKMTPTKFEFHVTSSDQANYADAPVDEWVHLAVVKKGTSFQSYVNGVPDATGTKTLEMTEAMPFFIGGDKGNSSGNEFFIGGIDDVRLYDAALTAGEIAYIVTDDGYVNPNSAIVDYTFDPSGTSSLSFQGGPLLDYVIKSTDDLPFTDFVTITPTAVTTGSLNGNVITTDGTGAATAEFTETSSLKFYKIETVPAP